MTSTQQSVETLHLFTSSARDLYISDAVDLLALPAGVEFQFRYAERWLSDDLVHLWGTKEFIGTPVLCHFNLTHAAHYFSSVFMPLREAVVVGSRKEGDTCTVIFRLGDYAPLFNVADKERAQAIAAYNVGLRERLSHHPDESKHAVLGPSLSDLYFKTGSAGTDFNVVVRYLAPSLPATDRVYYRVVGVRNDESATVSPSKGTYDLIAGKVYTVDVAHFQPVRELQGAALQLVAPASIEFMTRVPIRLRGRYDLIEVEVFTKPRDNLSSGILTFEVQGELQGPEISIPFFVRPGTGQALSGPVLGVGGAVALALPALFVSDTNLWLRVGLVVGGSLLVGLALWTRRIRGLPT